MTENLLTFQMLDNSSTVTPLFVMGITPWTRLHRKYAACYGFVRLEHALGHCPVHRVHALEVGASTVTVVLV